MACLAREAAASWGTSIAHRRLALVHVKAPLPLHTCPCVRAGAHSSAHTSVHKPAICMAGTLSTQTMAPALARCWCSEADEAHLGSGP